MCYCGSRSRRFEDRRRFSATKCWRHLRVWRLNHSQRPRPWLSAVIYIFISCIKIPVYDMSSILCSQTQLHSKRFLCVIVSMHFALFYIQVSSAAFRLRRRSRCWESSASLWQEGSARTTPKTGPSTRSACARGDGWFPLVLLAMSPPKQNHLSNYLDELRVRYSYSWLLFSRRC